MRPTTLLSRSVVAATTTTVSLVISWRPTTLPLRSVVATTTTTTTTVLLVES